MEQSTPAVADPKTSLLTVTDHGRQHVALAIAQGKAQTYERELEHVIVYFGAEEDMGQYLKEQEQLGVQGEGRRTGYTVRSLVIEKNGVDENITLGELWNRGIEACRGTFVVVWGVCDLYDRRRVERQVAAAEADKYCASTFNSVVVHETTEMAVFNGKERQSFLLFQKETGWEQSLCCRRDVMKQNKYEHLDKGADTLVLEALSAKGFINVIPHGVTDEKMYIHMRQGCKGSIRPSCGCSCIMLAEDGDEELWYDWRQKTYDFKEVLEFAKGFQPPASWLTEALLKPILERGPRMFPRHPHCGNLSAKDGNIVGETGQPAQLHGVSFFWSQWSSSYWRYSVVEWLKKDWSVNLIRAPMGVEHNDGYLALPDVNEERVDTIVQACVALGIYVIIDWHSHDACKDADREEKAIEFFTSMAKKYGKLPHVIFETWNEPERTAYSWDRLKTYHCKVIDAIRLHSQNLILVSGAWWASITREMVTYPITGYENIAFSFHAYFKYSWDLQMKITQANLALERGLAFMVTEWGVGDPEEKTPQPKEQSEVRWSDQEYRSTTKWVEFLRKNRLSHVVWAINDKIELHSFLMPEAPVEGNWTDKQLTEVGKFVKSVHRLDDKDDIRKQMSHEASDDILSDDCVQWMWADAGIVHVIAKLNPFRWSSTVKPAEAAAELRLARCLGARDAVQDRPVELNVVRDGGIKTSFIFSDVEYAIGALEAAVTEAEKAVANAAEAKMIFRSAHGKCVSARNRDGLTADVTEPQESETFTIKILGPVTVAFKSFHGTYVSATCDGTLKADCETIGQCEGFTIDLAGGGKAALRSCHGKYVCAEPNGTLRANRDELRRWEAFDMDTVIRY